MNSAGGRCHDNARCESMWARMKTELLYDRYDTKQSKIADTYSFPLDAGISVISVMHFSNGESE